MPATYRQDYNRIITGATVNHGKGAKHVTGELILTFLGEGKVAVTIGCFGGAHRYRDVEVYANNNQELGLRINNSEFTFRGSVTLLAGQEGYPILGNAYFTGLGASLTSTREAVILAAIRASLAEFLGTDGNADLLRRADIVRLQQECADADKAISEMTVTIGAMQESRSALATQLAALQNPPFPRVPVDMELFNRTAPAWNCIAFPGAGMHYLRKDGDCSWCGETPR